MKFTRLFILKVLTFKNEYSNSNEANFMELFREIIINHPDIDLSLSLIMSIIVLLTSISNNDNFLNSESTNFYLIIKINITVLMYYFFLEYIDHIVNNQIKLPFLFINYYHTFKALFNFVKNILCIISYFQSIIFCYFYSQQKSKLHKQDFLIVHFLILEFYQFYSAFRFCYFLVKVFINICLIPLYISSIFLGLVEDNFNKKLNDVVNTKQYTGRRSIKPVGRISEIDESCSICLISFKYQDYISTLPCSRRHTFHTRCLEKWFLNTVTCPLCRSDFHNSIELNLNNQDRSRVMVDLNQQLL